MTEFITTVLQFLMAAVTGGVATKLIEIWQKRKSQKHSSTLEDMAKMLNVMESLVQVSGIDRFIIFQGSNGGAEPKIGKDYFIKATYEAHKNKPDEAFVDKYSKIHADYFYIDMLISAKNNGVVKIEVDKMNNCKLKNFYLSEGVSYSEVYYLNENSLYFFYCSIASMEKDFNFDMDVNTRVKIDLAIDKLKQLFKKYYL